jgi:hypothetical protein
MRTAIATILLFLGIVSVAHPECAWVLWEQETLTASQGVDAQPWSLVQAMPSNAACENTLALTVKTRVKQAGARGVSLGKEVS